MNNKKLYHLHHRFTFLRAWYFLIPAAIFAVLAVQGLRTNYTTMVELRKAVYVADEQNGDVETALTTLRKHVYGHMNTNMSSGTNAIKPPIQLKARYERLAAVDKERVKQANLQVTVTAEQVCGAQFPGTGFNAPRVACVQEYVRANGNAKQQTIPDDLYKFDFASPKWSPDKAGISILLSSIFLVLFVARMLLEYYMRRRLR